MDNTNAIDVLERIRIMFPEWSRWSATLTSPAETMNAWVLSIQSQEYDDTMEVLDSWQTGKAKCPETYERDRLVYLLVEQARAIRNARFTKEQAKSQIASFTQEKAEAEKRRASYKPIKINGLGAAGVKFAHAADSIGKPKSQWTADDLKRYRALAAEIVADFERGLHAEPEIHQEWDGSY